MGKLNWTAESERWIRDIFEYIEAENPIAANEVVLGIYEGLKFLPNTLKLATVIKLLHDVFGFFYMGTTALPT